MLDFVLAFRKLHLWSECLMIVDVLLCLKVAVFMYTSIREHFSAMMDSNVMAALWCVFISGLGVGKNIDSLQYMFPQYWFRKSFESIQASPFPSMSFPWLEPWHAASPWPLHCSLLWKQTGVWCDTHPPPPRPKKKKNPLSFWASVRSLYEQPFSFWHQTIINILSLLERRWSSNISRGAVN